MIALQKTPSWEGKQKLLSIIELFLSSVRHPYTCLAVRTHYHPDWTVSEQGRMEAMHPPPPPHSIGPGDPRSPCPMSDEMHVDVKKVSTYSTITRNLLEIASAQISFVIT